MEQTDLSNPISAGEHLVGTQCINDDFERTSILHPFIHTDLPIFLLCCHCLPAVLKELIKDGEIPSAGFDPIKPFSKRLEELRQMSNNLLSILNINLKASQSVFVKMRLRKTHLNIFLQVFGQLNDLDCKSWIDKDSKTQHSSLTAQSNFVDSISTLKDLKRELNDLGDSDYSAVMELITEF
ncbi:hypothetical protein PPACK8108_LOCUS24185 [Phakopsora pachyrhizi]|uniref:Uncharacterized protein n=1 Tax=Phakopsora pachyrhizi TaxID=170000 RepID=A0AAV0BSA9_PHAPC|nr:hypothetical protein PPACK8108_LOCUS24185 [Phakopsora pachyrhizi]